MGCAQSTAVQQVQNEKVGGPHQGVDHKQQDPDPNKEKVLTKLFGGKHAILTYQWDVQEQVKAVRELLNAQGIPTWMDIDGYGAFVIRRCVFLLGPLSA